MYVRVSAENKELKRASVRFPCKEKAKRARVRARERAISREWVHNRKLRHCFDLVLALEKNQLQLKAGMQFIKNRIREQKKKIYFNIFSDLLEKN